MTGQVWSAEGYAHNAGFVPELGVQVVEMLAPRRGERILDLGCGDGRLTRRLVDAGCEVVGVDSSPEMVDAAVAAGLDARLMDARALPFLGEFDAVFSNAALHWMTEPDAVIRGVRKALKLGGRFVGELGGAGNVEAVVRGIDDSLRVRGMSFERLSPWYFPSAEAYRARLEAASMSVRECRLFARPTQLPTDLVGWLRTFAGSFTAAIPEPEREAFLEEVAGRCAEELSRDEGSWIVDYVRLRFSAWKPEPV